MLAVPQQLADRHVLHPHDQKGFEEETTPVGLHRSKPAFGLFIQNSAGIL